MDSDASEAQGTQDLALLGFDDLRKLATKHSIEGVSKLSRAELVESLRAFGVDARAGTYVSRLENALLSLTTCIENLSIEIVALKVGQKAEISALHAEIEVLKREIGSSEFKKVTPAPDAPVLSVPVAEVSPELDAAAQARNTHSAVNPYSYSAKVVSARPKAHFPSHSPMTQSATFNTGTHTDQALRTNVISYYQRPPRKHEQLRSAHRTKCKAVHVGRIHPGCSASSIAKWCENKQVTVLKCSVSETKYFGLAYAHVVVTEDDWEAVQNTDFWPDGVTAREWRFKADRISTADNTTVDQSAQ